MVLEKIGMSDETQVRAFAPFYMTRDVIHARAGVVELHSSASRGFTVRMTLRQAEKDYR